MASPRWSSVLALTRSLLIMMLLAGCGGGDSTPPTSSTSPNPPSTGSSGVFQAYVKASNTTALQFKSFGASMALSGDTLAVAADEASCATGVNGNQTNSGCPGAGAVYVFTRTGGIWSQQAYLKASNTEAGDGFGVEQDAIAHHALSLSGDTLAVGAVGEDSCSTGVNGNQADN